MRAVKPLDCEPHAATSESGGNDEGKGSKDRGSVAEAAATSESSGHTAEGGGGRAAEAAAAAASRSASFDSAGIDGWDIVGELDEFSGLVDIPPSE